MELDFEVLDLEIGGCRRVVKFLGGCFWCFCVNEVAF